MSKSKIVCRICRNGYLAETTSKRFFSPNGKKITVTLLTSQCDICENFSTLGGQHDENLKRLAARKEQYEGCLLGEEYVSLRVRYGLTKHNASKIFGKGPDAFSRYENEKSYPDRSTRLLMQLAIERPDIMKLLADKARVVLPLWPEP